MYLNFNCQFVFEKLDGGLTKHANPKLFYFKQKR